MKNIQFRFNLSYFLFALFIFLVEVFIAVKLENIFFIRAYLGDVIVVMFLYALVKSFFKVNDHKLILGILIFSCVVEFAQYFNIAEKSGFRHGSLMYIVIGNSFSWIDILCYIAGCLMLYFFVQIKEKGILAYKRNL
ncbi:DUF2809 domain-containing protein [Chryseobacterium flavum]|uniref:DUF2809 domain-containing protein n=1 Tax=Chryseobacterium flavum TaxID=415851 RepID=A0A3D9CJ98_9FLAO|nr:DUF2809 domain-containing protein [Chryseobacterium flavum]REC65739.1 DUF2809 domain-containing protein [Chryseobacterium flavum]